MPPPSSPRMHPQRRRSSALLATLVAGALALYLCAVLRPSQETSRLALRAGGSATERQQQPLQRRRDGELDREALSAEAAAEEVAAADALLPLRRSASSSSRLRRPTVHVLATSNGSPYLNYQTRIMHASWRRTRERQRSEEEEQGRREKNDMDNASPSSLPLLRGFTRILHRTTDDSLSTEVPTLRVSPRTPSCDDWCPFPVADRPEAVRSFFAAVRSRGIVSVPDGEEGDDQTVQFDDDLYFFYLVETDYVFLRPPPVPTTATSFSESRLSSPPSSLSSSSLSPPSGVDGLAFPFSYIEPENDLVVPILERLFGFSGSSGSNSSSSSSKDKESEKIDVASVPNTGPAPVLLPLRHWLRLLPRWVAYTEAIEADLEAREVLGWVREMYAFSCAAAASGVKLGLVAPPTTTSESGNDNGRLSPPSLPPLIAQPPEDETLGDASAIHYTWGVRIVETVDGGGGEGREGREGEEKEKEKEVVGGGQMGSGIAQEHQERLVWEFDKRKVTGADAVELLPRPPPLPEPFDPRWRLAGSKASRTRAKGGGGGDGWKRGKLVTRALYDSLKEQAREIDAAIDWIREGERRRERQRGEERSRGETAV